VNTITPTVVLPCPPDQFRDFIAGLLGRAQTIESVVEGPFEVNKQSIENLFHLIEQRIGSQNEATLVQFTSRVVYNDSSSVLLNSLQSFLSYNEVKPLISVGLHLSWTYLIKFQNKPFPEKQVIVISFDTTGHSMSLHGIGAVQLVCLCHSPGAYVDCLVVTLRGSNDEAVKLELCRFSRTFVSVLRLSSGAPAISMAYGRAAVPSVNSVRPLRAGARSRAISLDKLRRLALTKISATAAKDATSTAPENA
jgi:hypothetical protein